MAFTSFVDMRRTPAEKEEAIAPIPAIADVPDYPYGLCIRLTEEDLEKLDLDDDCSVGDMIHFSAMASVTGVSKNSTNGGNRVSVELQITHICCVEDEGIEAVEAEDEVEDGYDD